MMQSRIASTLQSSYRTSHRGLTTYCHIVPCILLLLMLMMRLAIQSGCYECRCHGPSCRWYLKLCTVLFINYSPLQSTIIITIIIIIIYLLRNNMHNK